MYIANAGHGLVAARARLHEALLQRAGVRRGEVKIHRKFPFGDGTRDGALLARRGAVPPRARAAGPGTHGRPSASSIARRPRYPPSRSREGASRRCGSSCWSTASTIHRSPDGGSRPPATAGTTWWARCSWAGSRRSTRARLPDLGVPLRAAGADRMAALAMAIDAFAPEAVLDLSDEPVHRLPGADGAGRGGARARSARTSVPTSGSTRRSSGPPLARAHDRRDRHRQAHREDGDLGELARLAARRGLEPVVVAMGRGGPPEPQVAEAGQRRPRPARRSWSAPGEHAASRLPRGRAHHRRDDDRRPACRRRPRGRAVRHERPGGRRDGVGAGAGARDPGGERLGRAAGPLGRGVLVVPAGVPAEYLGGYLGPLPPLAVGPRGCYHGCRPNYWAREPLRTPSPTSGATSVMRGRS